MPSDWDVKNPATRTNALRARDITAVAAMIAAVCGGSFNWNGGVSHCFANHFNGGFGRGMNLGDFGNAIYEGTEPVPEPWRSWLRKTGVDYLNLVYQSYIEDASWPDRVLAELQDLLV